MIKFNSLNNYINFDGINVYLKLKFKYISSNVIIAPLAKLNLFF